MREQERVFRKRLAGPIRDFRRNVLRALKEAARSKKLLRDFDMNMIRIIRERVVGGICLECWRRLWNELVRLGWANRFKCEALTSCHEIDNSIRVAYLGPFIKMSDHIESKDSK